MVGGDPLQHVLSGGKLVAVHGVRQCGGPCGARRRHGPAVAAAVAVLQRKQLVQAVEGVIHGQLDHEGCQRLLHTGTR